MGGKCHHDLRRYIMSQWILLVILVMLPYSVSACERDFCAQCSSNDDSCDICKSGYYLYFGNCYQCQHSNCVMCSSSSNCTGCNDGYYLYNGYCIQCIFNCATCSSASTCTRCNDGYYIYNGYCYQCQDSNCVTYSSSLCCTRCNDGYYLSFGSCNQCKSNCATCSSASTCTRCNDGYYLSYGNCYQCQDSNCATCSSYSTCTGCNDGYYLKNGNCNQCQDSNCVTCSSSSFCSGCNDGYYLQDGLCYLGTTKSTNGSTCQLNDECHKELNSCLQQVYASGVSEEQYRLTFGHGLAIGIGISIVLFGCGVGIALFIRRKTDLHKQCFGRDGHSDDRHEHVMNDILSVTPYDNNRVHNAIHPISGASTNVDSSKEYVSLGERLTHESDYTDLQNT